MLFRNATRTTILSLSNGAGPFAHAVMLRNKNRMGSPGAPGCPTYGSTLYANSKRACL